MADKWSAQEILDIAVRVEKNGQQLYAALEKKATEVKLKQAWRYLKEQEIVHQETFDEMLKKAGDYLMFEFGTGEYNAYLKAIASEYIFTSKLIKEKTAKPLSSDKEAIEFALAMEKESILVYTALEEQVVEGKKKILKKIINEEKKHFVILTDLKSKLA